MESSPDFVKIDMKDFISISNGKFRIIMNVSNTHSYYLKCF